MDILNEFPLCAIGDQPSQAVLDKHIDMRYKTENRNRIHGFAETKAEKLKRYPYYSVDSTSRQIGSRYGQVVAYSEESFKFKTFNKFDRSRAGIEDSVKSFSKFYHELEAKGQEVTVVDYIDYTKGSVYRDTQNALAFIRYGIDADRLWKSR